MGGPQDRLARAPRARSPGRRGDLSAKLARGWPVLPVDYVRERHDLAGARREAFVELPTRRNRVWQMDFFELKTSGGGTWRSGDVIDYATVLAGPVTATQTHRDAIASVQLALDAAAELLGRPLLEDATDPVTGEVMPVFLVTDNGPCFKAAAFARFIASRPELTRERSPQTNGLIERYHGAIMATSLITPIATMSRSPTRSSPRRRADAVDRKEDDQHGESARRTAAASVFQSGPQRVAV